MWFWVIKNDKKKKDKVWIFCMKKIKEKERVVNWFFLVINSFVSYVLIVCLLYNDSFVIRLVSDKGVDRILGNIFD